MMELDLSKALQSLRPGASWGLNGNSYDGLDWDDSNDLPAPTEEELIAEAERLSVEFVNTQYQRDRQKEYPSFGDQLDLLYHGGLDAWREEINKVKEKYPRPEGS